MFDNKQAIDYSKRFGTGQFLGSENKQFDNSNGFNTVTGFSNIASAQAATEININIDLTGTKDPFKRID